jgi:hypothetical protein
MTSFPDPTIHWKEAVELARSWRGVVLERALLVERAIDNILSHSFCSDEKARSSFRELLLLSGALSLSSKTRVLRDLLRAEHQDLFEKFKETLAHIEDIRELRNRIAHSQLDLPKEPSQSSEIHLTGVSKGKRCTYTLTEKDINAMVTQCTNTARSLIILQETLIDRLTGLGTNTKNRAFLDEIFRVIAKPEYDHLLYKAIEIPGSLRKLRLLSSGLDDAEAKS